ADWDFTKLGFHETADPLVAADYAPYGNDLVSKNLRRVFGTSWYRAEYVKSIEESDASVIHAHFLSGGMNVARLASDLGIPLVTTLHNPRVSPAQSRLPRSFRATYARRLQRLVSTGAKFV